MLRVEGRDGWRSWRPNRRKKHLQLQFESFQRNRAEKRGNKMQEIKSFLQEIINAAFLLSRSFHEFDNFFEFCAFFFHDAK